MGKMTKLMYDSQKRCVTAFGWIEGVQLNCGLIADLSITSRLHPSLPSLLSSPARWKSFSPVNEQNFSIFVPFAVVPFEISSVLEMNYTQSDCRVMNMWQRLYFNTQSSDARPDCRADAWRRLLAQLQILTRRFVWWRLECVKLKLYS